MQITIFSGFSKEANSTKQPSGGTAVSCVLKENVSVVHPVFILERTDTSINYIQWGSRYYFVDDIIFLSNTTIELHCTVDVLATYKIQIGTSSQYVVRSASQFDTYCMDGLYPVQNKESDSLTSLIDINFLDQTGCYVVGIIGDSGQGVSYYSMTVSTFRSFMSVLFGGTWLDAPTTEISLELQKELVNPFQFIASVQWFPFSIGGTSKAVRFGYWNSGIIAEEISESNRIVSYTQQFALPSHPQISRGKYLNGSPFTRHTCYFYVWGSFPIDPNYFIDNSAVVFSLRIDLFTGAGILSITNSNGNCIYRNNAQVGVPIQISQVTQNLVQTGVGIIDFAKNLVSGNVLGATAGIMNAVQGLSPQVQTAGAMGSKANYSIAPYIISTFYSLVDEDNSRNGRPLMKQKTINTLSGYIQVENPDVDIVGTVWEKDQIMEYMMNGFYYE